MCATELEMHGDGIYKLSNLRKYKVCKEKKILPWVLLLVPQTNVQTVMRLCLCMVWDVHNKAKLRLYMTILRRDYLQWY